MDESFFDEEREKIQRALNEARKRELEDKFGAHFSDDRSVLPSEVESQWLSDIEEFERQFENAKQVTVREYLGFPTFKPLAEISSEQIGAELDDVVELLSCHCIAVDSIADVSDEELYRFITSELINEEIDDIHIEGMRQCFIYEESHPNDECDAKSAAEHFLWELFGRCEEDLVGCYAKDELFDPSGQRINVAGAVALVRAFCCRYAAFTFHEFKCPVCTLDGEYATVRLEGQWSGLLAESITSVSHKGVAEFRLKKSPYGGYDVVQANIPGFVG